MFILWHWKPLTHWDLWKSLVHLSASLDSSTPSGNVVIKRMIRRWWKPWVSVAFIDMCWCCRCWFSSSVQKWVVLAATMTRTFPMVSLLRSSGGGQETRQHEQIFIYRFIPMNTRIVVLAKTLPKRVRRGLPPPTTIKYSKNRTHVPSINKINYTFSLSIDLN